MDKVKYDNILDQIPFVDAMIIETKITISNVDIMSELIIMKWVKAY